MLYKQRICFKCIWNRKIEDLPTTEEDEEEMEDFFSNLVNQKEIQNE